MEKTSFFTVLPTKDRKVQRVTLTNYYDPKRCDTCMNLLEPSEFIENFTVHGTELVLLFSPTTCRHCQPSSVPFPHLEDWEGVRFGPFIDDSGQVAMWHERDKQGKFAARDGSYLGLRRMSKDSTDWRPQPKLNRKKGARVILDVPPVRKAKSSLWDAEINDDLHK